MATLDQSVISRGHRLYVREAYEKTGDVCEVESTSIEQGIQDCEDWFSADPTGDTFPSRSASLNNALNADFKAGTNSSQRGILLAAYAGAVAGI